MKNIILGLFLLLFIASCTKDKESTTSNSKSSTESDKPSIGGGSGLGSPVSMGGGGSCCEENNYTLLDVGADEWCCNPGTNCMPCVTITADFQITLDQLVEDGASAVATYFSGQEWAQHLPELVNNDYEMLSKLQSGNYSLEKMYDTETGKIIYRAFNLDGDYFGIPGFIE